MATSPQLLSLTNTKDKALEELKNLQTTAELREWQVQYLGRKAEIVLALRSVKDLPEAERAGAGKTINELRKELETAAEKQLTVLEKKELQAKLETEFLDVTIPSITPTAGKLHPITKEREIIENIFREMGFTVWEPYLVDDDYNNFEAVNIPAGHPARDMWDTIRVDDNLSMIVHTSSMQNRIISADEPPIRAIVPGKTFRNEATDARHEHSFFQVEGVYVDKGIKLSDMLGTLREFLKNYFRQEVELKIQPTFFPFVEPGMELMMNCPVCKGEKPATCAGCSGSGWMEVIPCGPIHPNVIREAGLDPEIYTGFAWGFGLDRMIMVKYGINDVRLFHSGKLDFIRQFS